MATLAELGGSPSQTVFSDNLVIVEPLDGPTSVEDVMDRFPEEVYHQGRDTHLYRFLSALCGDAGAGLAKKQSYAARLKYEAEFLNFSTLDEIYVAQFSFKRLATETYSGDASADALTYSEWDAVQLADQSFFHRVQEFWTATRYGNNAEGMRLAAQAGTGLICDIIAHYKYIFDQYSDDPLGLVPNGITISTDEFVVVPRVYPDSPEVYEVNRQRVWTYHAPVLATGARPVPAPTGGNKFSVSMAYSTDPKVNLDPAIEHNAVNLLDRLRAVDTFATFEPQDSRFRVIDDLPDPSASSERTHVVRLVTGATGVTWPPVDKSINAFIEGGVENESGYYYGSGRELPVIFKTPEAVNSYTNYALQDSTYGTAAFFEVVGGVAPSDLYKSDHIGEFFALMGALFPFLAAITIDQIFNANQAIANQDTPLVLEGNSLFS